MMRRMFSVATLAALLALALPSVAFGAGVLEYQLEYTPVTTDGRALLIVTASLDPQQPLPAEVRVPVPTGGVVLWAGEVLRRDSAADAERPTTVERVGDMDVYTLTLEGSYTAQLEVELPPPTVDGLRVKSAMSWTNPDEQVLVLGSVVVEADAGDVKTTPELGGTVTTNANRQSLYPLQGKRLAAGETYAISAEWTRGAGGAGAGKPKTSVPPLLLIALGSALVALLAALVAQRNRSRTPRSGE